MCGGRDKKEPKQVPRRSAAGRNMILIVVWWYFVYNGQMGLIKGLNRIKGIMLMSQMRESIRGQWKILVVKGDILHQRGRIRGQTAFPSECPSLKEAIELKAGRKHGPVALAGLQT